MITIDIISDTVCPWCFIGKKRLEKAFNKSSNIDFNINWHCFQLNPNMPTLGINRSIYLSKKFGGSQKASIAYSEIKKAGIYSGIDFNFDKISTMPNSYNTHLLIEYSKEIKLQDRIVENLFTSYFIQGENIGKDSVLTNIAVNSGINNFSIKDLLARDDLKENIHKTDINNKNIGITGVPFFIFNKTLAVSGAQDSEVFEKIFETCKINN